MQPPKRSPWGKVQQTDTVIPGKAYVVYTASHGGIKLDRSLNQRIPEAFRNKDGVGWYEEDCAWAIACHFVPELISSALHPEHRKALERVVRSIIERYYPEVLGWTASQN